MDVAQKKLLSPIFQLWLARLYAVPGRWNWKLNCIDEASDVMGGGGEGFPLSQVVPLILCSIGPVSESLTSMLGWFFKVRTRYIHALLESHTVTN